MRAVSEGRAVPDARFASFMDLCLACRACEDVCPSQVPFGRMMERARTQIEPLRKRRERLLRWLGLEVVLPHPRLVGLAAWAARLARPGLPRPARDLVPRRRPAFGWLPAVTEPRPGTEPRGTVALLAGCVQDRWFRDANLATIRVLAAGGWRVEVPRGQVCCGALAAHHGRLDRARRLARRNVDAFAGADRVVVNAAGCGAHLKEIGDLFEGEAGDRAAALGAKVRDLMEFLDEEGPRVPVTSAGVERVAYHDACHALRAQGIRAQPRRLLEAIPGVDVVEIPDGDRCCGAAGLYNLTQPATAAELGRAKAEAIVSTGAGVVASANPGCSMQLEAHLRRHGPGVQVMHPIELLDRAVRADGDGERPDEEVQP
jgi:glycolate oxidase iron-sulfur subunit